MRANVYVLAVTIGLSGPCFSQPNEADWIAANRQLRPQCALPAVPADHDLILVGAVEAQTITNYLGTEILNG